MTDFTGFPPGTVRFLGDLAENNHKAWFDAHREEYEAFWVAPARAFVVAAGEALREIAPDVCAEPRINGSILRVNRDIRFSRDKSPYKDHLDFWFWEGERTQAVSGFYLRITPTDLGIGVGAHGFDRETLAAFRDAVADDESGKALIRAVRTVASDGFAIHGEKYQRLPRGYEPIDEHRDRLLRHGSLWAGTDVPIPASLHNRRLVPYAMNRWSKMAPLHHWLVDNVQ